MSNIINLQEEKNSKLNPDKFHALVVEKLTEIFNDRDEGYVIQKEKREKNNRTKIGYSIRYKNECISPTVYPFEEKLVYTMEDVENTAKYVTEVYDKNIMRKPKSDITQLTDKNYVLSNVVYSVVSKKGNDTYLKDKIAKDYLDLAVIYRVYLRNILEKGEEDTESFSVLITNAVLQQLGITVEELDEAARVNTSKYMGFTAKPVDVTIHELDHRIPAIGYGEYDMSNVSYLPKYLEKYPEQKNMLYVMYGGKYQQHSASIILYPEYFEALANAIDSDLYIIPSSIHECMAFSSKYRFFSEEIEEIKELISFMNTEEVSDEEVLTNSLYKYSRDTGEITIV